LQPIILTVHTWYGGILLIIFFLPVEMRKGGDTLRESFVLAAYIVQSLKPREPSLAYVPTWIFRIHTWAPYSKTWPHILPHSLPPHVSPHLSHVIVHVSPPSSPTPFCPINWEPVSYIPGTTHKRPQDTVVRLSPPPPLPALPQTHKRLKSKYYLIFLSLNYLILLPSYAYMCV